jgi:hypothetical protein
MGSIHDRPVGLQREEVCSPRIHEAIISICGYLRISSPLIVSMSSKPPGIDSLKSRRMGYGQISRCRDRSRRLGDKRVQRHCRLHLRHLRGTVSGGRSKSDPKQLASIDDAELKDLRQQAAEKGGTALVGLAVDLETASLGATGRCPVDPQSHRRAETLRRILDMSTAGEGRYRGPEASAAGSCPRRLTAGLPKRYRGDGPPDRDDREPFSEARRSCRR